MIPRKQTHTRKMMKLRRSRRRRERPMMKITQGMSTRRRRLKKRRLMSLLPPEARLARGDPEKIIRLFVRETQSP